MALNDPDEGAVSPLDRLILYAVPASSVAESFRTVRANVSRAMDQGARTILVVSTWPNDGKSMVTANMAVAFAQIRKRVVLVDADLRRPTLSDVFDMREDPGLASALQTDTVDVQTLMRQTSQEGLWFLPSGPLPTHPSDLVSGARARAVIDRLASVTDCVLLDSPPLSVCSDAVVLSRLVDAVIMVINPRLWEGERELRAKESLEESGAKILGVILNEVEERDVNYASYHYYGADYRARSKPGWKFWGGNGKK